MTMARSAAARKVGEIPRWTKVRQGLFAVSAPTAAPKRSPRRTRPPCRPTSSPPLAAEPARKAAPRVTNKAAKASARPAAAPAARPKVHDCARTFRTFCFFGALLVLVAAATVWVRTDCAVKAYTISKMKMEIAAERQTMEELDVRSLAMGTPSRIEKMAQGRLAMVEPDMITFLQRRLPPVHRAAPRREAPRRRTALDGMGAWLARTAQDFTILSLGELGLPSAGP
jgi:hypothetical protein